MADRRERSIVAQFAAAATKEITIPAHWSHTPIAFVIENLLDLYG
jgi:hypothetical protein